MEGEEKPAFGMPLVLYTEDEIIQSTATDE
jgi:hypothetical protein